jgi:hypothetical protein
VTEVCRLGFLSVQGPSTKTDVRFDSLLPIRFSFFLWVGGGTFQQKPFEKSDESCDVMSHL